MKRYAHQNVTFDPGDILVCPRCEAEAPTEGLDRRWKKDLRHECPCGYVYVIKEGKIIYSETP